MNEFNSRGDSAGLGVESLPGAESGSGADDLGADAGSSLRVSGAGNLLDTGSELSGESVSGADDLGADDLGADAGSSLRARMEAVLLAAGRGLKVEELMEILGVTGAEVERGLEFLGESYRSSERGFELRETESGYALFTKPEFSGAVAHALGGFDQIELTQPALETLAIIAYRGPVARSEISRIRGVQADAMVRNLYAMGLIERSLNPDDARTYLYRLSNYCFEQLGMVDASELPPIAPYLPENLAELGLLNEFEDIRKSRRQPPKTADPPSSSPTSSSTNFSASSQTSSLASSQTSPPVSSPTSFPTSSPTSSSDNH